MENAGKSFRYDLKKADLVNFIVIMALLAIVIEQAVMRAESVLSDVISALCVALLVFVNYRFTPSRFVKSLLFGVIPALAVCANIVMNPFGVDRHYMLLMTVVVVALYFNSRLVLVYGGLLNACALPYISPRPQFHRRQLGCRIFSVGFLYHECRDRRFVFPYKVGKPADREHAKEQRRGGQAFGAAQGSRGYRQKADGLSADTGRQTAAKPCPAFARRARLPFRS
jgi:hypothetical protein